MTNSRTGLALQYEQTIRKYFEGCNEANVEKMESCFTPDAVHYFPPGMYGGAWRGRDTIAANWVNFVETKGSAWVIESMIVEADRHHAVIEWTHYKNFENTVLRGDEWYQFDPETGLITEIRAYYASPADPQRQINEIDDFDYVGRGYSLETPVQRQQN